MSDPSTLAHSGQGLHSPLKMRRLITKETDKPDAINTRSVKAGTPHHTCEIMDDAPFETEAHRATLGRRRKLSFAVSLNGFYLLTRCFAEVGDVIAMLNGRKVPVVLRRVKSDGDREFEKDHEFVGVVHVHGTMDGEVEGAVVRGRLQMEEILLA